MRPGLRLALAVAAVLGALAGALELAPPTVDVGHLVAGLATRPPPPLSAREARLEVLEHAAINRILGYTTTVSSGGSAVREVALTFDDGPSAFTPAVIAILQRLHVPATFFQTGYSITAYPQFARRELDVGLGIGDHTLTHPFLAVMTPSAQQAQIVGAARQIHAYGAPYPRLFRPPYESFDSATLTAARNANMLMVLWSVDTRDFSRPGVGRIVATALSGARPGAIILMHDGGGPRAQTVAALPRVIRGLRRRHFRLVTVGRLLLDDPPAPPEAASRPAARPAARQRQAARTVARRPARTVARRPARARARPGRPAARPRPRRG
jgi:peptidoglycan/xylan/chitin deacetylase (PgdA/CDA1 family)